MNINIKRHILVDPSYKIFYGNTLFDRNHSLNSDGLIEPFARAKKNAENKGISIDTIDIWLESDSKQDLISNMQEYYSLGITENYKNLSEYNNIKLRSFVVFEPPAVAPKLYRNLPLLTRYFEEVYVHNTYGNGYSLKGVISTKLKKLYWPQPYYGVIDDLWNYRDRKKSIVVINGNHIPRSFSKQLYSERIYAMAELAKSNAVDLYGRGWDKWWSHRSMWPPYWFNRNTLMSIYKGECKSKHETLSNYEFCLCFENMEMDGYITEKIFDCLYTGTIPIYLGAPDINQYIPDGAYIDVRRFNNYNDMWNSVKNMSEAEISHIRNKGKEFMESKAFDKYYNSLDRMFSI